MMFPSLSGGHQPKWNTWLAVCGSMIGLFIISDAEISNFSLGRGEILTVICSLFWTLHIMFTDYATNHVDAVYLTFVQFIGTASLTAVLSFCYEYNEWNINHLLLSWPVIILLGVMECLGFTIGAVGQTNAPSFHAAIIYGSEAVFATIGGFFFLGESFSLREWIGCSLMLTSTIIAKIDFEPDVGHIVKKEPGKD
jgi:drug/metabolite transporter (DMT)-like permease